MKVTQVIAIRGSEKFVVQSALVESGFDLFGSHGVGEVSAGKKYIEIRSRFLAELTGFAKKGVEILEVTREKGTKKVTIPFPVSEVLGFFGWWDDNWLAPELEDENLPDSEEDAK